ncbi:hypothetical protein LI951_02925 [Enterococcus sp. BWT-B8]|uniref:hypothetical protein n=1 Tax=Enterococcus sp. BWT-B8 TaxID=2885157 RepID=UPI001E4DEFCA|nr:hypothetical protein [Enterococcus sp. BWT-B8]MCB5951013.1 hypothetical protein [Enterococcus sp. BWT-B8]
MSNKDRLFTVDKRYEIIVRPSKSDLKVCIDLANQKKVEPEIETGEDLELISLYSKNLKLSIGTKENLEGFTLSYLTNGWQINVSEGIGISDIVIYVVWLYDDNLDINGINAWYAADPTIA